MKLVSLTIALALTASVVACDAPATDTNAKGDSSAKADGKKAGDTKPAKSDAPKDVKLKETKDDELGYTIMLPEGSKVLQKDKLGGHTYSLVIGGGHEFNTHITGVEHKDLDSLKRQATMMGGKELEEEKEIDGGLLRVIKKPRMSLSEVWVAVKGKPLGVKCTGPEKEKAKLIEICSSLKFTKK